MSRRARAYLVANRFLTQGLGLVRGAFTGVSLAVLDREDTHAVDAAFYDRHRQYLSPAYNQSGLFAWERRTWDEHFTACRRVVVLAAGGGREVLALRRLGVQVDGYECNPRLVKVANAVLGGPEGGAEVRLLGRDAAPPATIPYDGAILGWSDAAGNLYIADQGNHRVLKYTTPFSSDTTADLVFGQLGSFTSGVPDINGVTADSLESPGDVADAAGNVYIAETGNERMLEFDSPATLGTTADLVFRTRRIRNELR